MVKKRRSYSRKFKLKTVAMVTQGGVKVVQAARNLGISENSLWRWKKEFEEYPKGLPPDRVRVPLLARLWGWRWCRESVKQPS